MSRKLKYIALFFTVVFAFTLIPYNAIHQHEEDLHEIALVQGNKSQHHCHLDENYCDELSSADCGHPSHISKPIAKCFICKFNFTKTFKSIVFGSNIKLISSTFTFVEPIFKLRNFLTIGLKNKSPPQV